MLTGSEVSASLLMLTASPARSGSTVGASLVTLTVSDIAPTVSEKSTRERAADPDRHLSARRLESLELGPCLVGRRRQVVDAVDSLRVGDCGELSERLRALQRHGDAGQHAAAGIGDLADDRAGAAGLSERQHGKRHEHCKEQHRNSSSHHFSS